MSSIKNKKKNEGEEKKIIKEYLKKRDSPGWFRGLSLFQLKAADELLNSIRDDSEQGTTHRVRDVLITLGIEPAVSGSRIKLAMRLSRGNDMAFLWFLMELYYRHSCDGCEHESEYGYTTNEQVIYSAIAHLDTVATLRELDKILPKQPPQEPKKKLIKKKKIIKEGSSLPYFERQPRPVHYGTRLVSEEKDIMVNIINYAKYLNPNYVIPNEASRWFADYVLGQGGDGYIHSFNNEEIDGDLEHHEENPNPVVEQSSKTFGVCDCEMRENVAWVEEDTRPPGFNYFDLEGEMKNDCLRRFSEMLDQEKTSAEERGKKRTPDCMQTFPLPQTSETEVCTNFYDDYFKAYDLGHANTSGIKKCNLFTAPAANMPYQFNYPKIFDMGARDPIKKAAANVLKEGDSSGDESLDHCRAVCKCCKNMWEIEVDKFKADYEEQMKQDEATRAKCSAKFNLPYYNPRDAKLMASMLEHAINEIKKNKKFVLVQLPDSHKTPVLKEWIKRRYGRVYSKKDRIGSFQVSRTVFHALKKHGITATIPDSRDLTVNRDVSYACKDYLLKKTNFLQDKYHHNFKESLLEATRIYWLAVRPYHCTKGPPRNTFFAYLPARKYDIPMFRPWQISEFMPARAGWDRRQKIKRLEVLY